MPTKAVATPGAKGDEFPILCETCLGPNPYVRMLKQPWGSACKVCERPFTSFRWRPAGHGMRPKKTEVCLTCARSKNVCQTCLLDLQYGLPVQVRDASLAAADRQRTVVPQSDGTREYAAAQAERAIASGEVDSVYAAPKVNNIAERAKRTAPHYERNRARICSFYVRGECKRGLYCPYRHEMPPENADGMGEQNLRDRYYGVNDPVANKILQKAAMAAGKRRAPGRGNGQRNQAPPPPPQDRSVKTFFIGGVTPAVSERDLREFFSNCNGLSRISVLAGRKIAFADFESRDAAELAMQTVHGPHDVNGARIVVNWGRGSKKRAEGGPEGGMGGSAMGGAGVGGTPGEAAVSTHAAPVGDWGRREPPPKRARVQEPVASDEPSEPVIGAREQEDVVGENRARGNVAGDKNNVRADPPPPVLHAANDAGDAAGSVGTTGEATVAASGAEVAT